MKKQKDYTFLKNSIRLEKGNLKKLASNAMDIGFIEEDSEDAMFSHQQKIDDLVDMHEEILNLHSRILHVSKIS